MAGERKIVFRPGLGRFLAAAQGLDYHIQVNGLMKKPLTEIVIPKEEAVFFLDKQGFWRHKERGRLEHRGIIDSFHSGIRKDEYGYHLRQRLRNRIEKVYFHCEDTALFVFDVIKGEKIILVLNTKSKIQLRPRKLFVKNDALYMRSGEHGIKFTEHSLIRILDLLDLEGDRYFITVRGKRYRIAEPKKETP
jgi:hypothetical protein